MGCSCENWLKGWTSIQSAVLIQRWYRRYVARLEMRRRCTWRIFQSIEYAGEHDHMKVWWETVCGCQQLHPYYVLKLFQEVEQHLSHLPNINRISTCYSEEITVCGKSTFCKIGGGGNGLPSPQKLYVFNGDFVDRGTHSIEILIIIFIFLLIYPKEVHLNRGNHEDYMINFRYGFTKEVTRKYKVLQFAYLLHLLIPLATVIDRKVLIVHGGISDKTDLERLAKVERCYCKISIPAHPTNLLCSSVLLCRATKGDPAHHLGLNGRQRIDRVIDILWSDPDPKPGCTENEERGGGCYFGPDVTDTFLQKHRLQFIIRSHECKPEGYEVDHNRKVITIFSASNYYAPGSNRGAYIKLGPDLIPHFVQFQATKGVSRQLSITQRSAMEESAYQILKEQLFAHRSELIAAFRGYDKRNTGLISVNDWAKAIESVLQLGLPWRMLRPHLILQLTNGRVDYRAWLKDIVTEEKSSTQEVLHRSDITVISDLPTPRKIALCSRPAGFICLEEFHQMWKLFSAHMNIDISDENIRDLARSMDFNKDGKIDFNEFLEAFRLVKQPPS
uniref:Serine/threonine-protein phosphatase n=1 Tax=Pseudonaja textilis TaxID=8673 RepID=A0A670ZUT7_PSETE